MAESFDEFAARMNGVASPANREPIVKGLRAGGAMFGSRKLGELGTPTNVVCGKCRNRCVTRLGPFGETTERCPYCNELAWEIER